MRVGAAIVAELEALARANGMQRLSLEIAPHMVSMYENFGFTVRNCRTDGETFASTHVEKMLTT